MAKLIKSIRRRNVVDQPEDRNLWLYWIIATAIGEFIGFAIPSVVGPVADMMTGRFFGAFADRAMIGIMAMAGMGEGAVLGYAQWLVLRDYIKGLAREEWILVTAVAAAAAWLLGMLPGMIGNSVRIDPALMMVALFFLAVAILFSIGFAQWIVLSRYIRRAEWWIPANGLAWLLGVSVPFICLNLVPNGAPPYAWALTGIASGIMMGLVVGTVTGGALVWIVQRDRSSP